VTGPLATVDVEAVAARLADAVAGGLPARGYVDTATVAAFLSVSQDWVRRHAAELGAIRVGDSPRGPLRFDVRRVQGAVERRRLGPPPERRRRRPGPARAADVELLPLPRDAA
jgi:hypothetical protein